MTNEPANAPRRKLSILVGELPWKKDERSEADVKRWEEARNAALIQSHLKQAQQG